MGLIKGGALRLFQTFLYALCFCCAGIILGVYSYFLSVLADRNDHIRDTWKAVEGMSGVAVVYTIFAVVLTCCLGGIPAFAFLAILLDVLFAAAMIAIAVLTRNGASSCKGFVHTPIGNGPANSHDTFNNDPGHHITIAVKLGTACRLNTASFAVAIVAALLFLCTAAMQVALVRRHKKEKRFGPSPSNNYTSGFGKRKWGRKNKNVDDNSMARDAEMGSAAGAGGLAAPGVDTRPSHETGSTFEHTKPETHASHAGYHTQPTGTGVNPYGYNNNTTTTNSTSVNY